MAIVLYGGENGDLRLKMAKNTNFSKLLKKDVRLAESTFKSMEVKKRFFFKNSFFGHPSPFGWLMYRLLRVNYVHLSKTTFQYDDYTEKLIIFLKVIVWKSFFNN